ncbi:MAG: hypothetical protein ABI612_00465 [Betaproteobacteria bacterium]
MKHSVQTRWDRLSAADIDAINGDRAALCNRLQASYGLNSEDANGEVMRWENQYCADPHRASTADDARAEELTRIADSKELLQYSGGYADDETVPELPKETPGN